MRGQRPQGGGQSARAFPLARVSRKPLKTGLAYAMTVQDKPMNAPPVQLPVRSSLGQQILIHRFQNSHNYRLLRNYGFAPGNPILQAESIPNQANTQGNTPKPVFTRFGMQAPVPGQSPVFPRVSGRGSMGSPKRFPKSLLVPPNTYAPPVYGTDSAQPQSDPGTYGS